MDINDRLDKLIIENEYIDQHNFLVSKLPAKLAELLTISHTDSLDEMRKKKKKAKELIKRYTYFLPLYPHNLGTMKDKDKDDPDGPDVHPVVPKGDTMGSIKTGTGGLSNTGEPIAQAGGNPSAPEAPSAAPAVAPSPGEEDEETNETAFEYTGGKAAPVTFDPLHAFTIKNADPDAGVDTHEDEVDEAMSSTERMRRYNRRHPEKVRKYLKDTVKDRVARNRDRKKAVKKYGKSKMKNHDVHHPNGPNGGKWKLARKDHGRDKKNEHIEYVYMSELYEGNVPNGPWALINEGGAAGHLAHPYEDDSLTFTDVKEMIKRGLVGGLDTEAPVTEKLDGQNLTFSVVNGRVVFARNKGQIKNFGQNALPAADLRQMFAGRGAIEKSFGNAADDLQKAIDALPDNEREELFGNGRKFMNVEVIFPDTKNVIPYDKPVLVFHGTIEYDKEGNEVGRNINDGKVLDDQLRLVSAQQQQTYGLSGPQAISFNDADTARNIEKLKEYGDELGRLQRDFDLDDKSTIEDYKKAWWRREIDNLGVELTDDQKEKLVLRWAMGDKKAIGVKDFENPETKKWFRTFEGEQLDDMQRICVRPLEKVFLKVGVDTLRRVTNLLSANNPEARKSLHQELLTAIKSIRDTGDRNQLAILQKQIERLDDLGIKNVVPSEGIVFMYNGKPYKFTGTFAPVNQILGMMKFGRGKAKEVEEPKEEPTKKSAEQPKAVKPISTGEKRTVAIFTGRFQPFHAGHYSIYRALVKKFGEDNVFIASSDKTDATKSPFNFNQKKEIMTQMFDIPEDKVVQVKNPYAPSEILSTLSPNTVYVTAVSQKDSERLTGGKYFKNYNDVPEKNRKPYEDQGYFIIAPEMQLQLNGKNISGTQVRAIMGNPKFTDRAKQEIFTKIYGKFDQDIFKKIVKVTTDSEEALKLTQQYGGDKAEKPKITKTKKPVEPKKSTAAKQKQPPIPKDPSFYKPGETWETEGGNFGGKNRKNQVRYFSTQDRATKFAKN